MYSQYRNQNIKQTLLADISTVMKNEFESDDFKDNVLDPVITHVLLRMQPWIATLLVIFGIYFILIILILVLIIRNDIKK
tara:strand:+ start:374 stop:613 length:240 start_codon:yes stop_codon:yes gene_type:complete